MIAMVLSLFQKAVTTNEAVATLDVSTRIQTINLSHDLAAAKQISDRIGVMCLGKMVELAGNRELFGNSPHPYTVALMSAIPIPDPTRRKQRIILLVDVPSPINPPSGCRFHPRCPIAKEICSKEEPLLRDVGGGHSVACHFPGGLR